MTTTRDLAQPGGWAFKNLAPLLWDQFRRQVLRRTEEKLSRRTTSSTSIAFMTSSTSFPCSRLPQQTSLQLSQAPSSATLPPIGFISRSSRRRKSRSFHETRRPVCARRPERTTTRSRKSVMTSGSARLRNHDWCPTTLRARAPGARWSGTPEVERRFGRQGSTAGALLPLLVADRAHTQGKALGLADPLARQ